MKKLNFPSAKRLSLILVSTCPQQPLAITYFQLTIKFLHQLFRRTIKSLCKFLFMIWRDLMLLLHQLIRYMTSLVARQFHQVQTTTSLSQTPKNSTSFWNQLRSLVISRQRSLSTTMSTETPLVSIVKGILMFVMNRQSAVEKPKETMKLPMSVQIEPKEVWLDRYATLRARLYLKRQSMILMIIYMRRRQTLVVMQLTLLSAMLNQQ